MDEFDSNIETSEFENMTDRQILIMVLTEIRTLCAIVSAVRDGATEFVGKLEGHPMLAMLGLGKK